MTTITNFKAIDTEKTAPILPKLPVFGDCFLLANNIGNWEQYNNHILMKIYNGWFLLDKPLVTFMEVTPDLFHNSNIRGWPIKELNITYRVEK